MKILPRKKALRVAVAVSALAFGSCRLAANSGPETLWNLSCPTAGGQQLWSDVAFAGGWRVQENVLTGHGRLLDPENHRRAWGSVEACELSLEERRAAGEIAPAKGKVVVLLHGLWRTRRSMAPLGAAFEKGGYDVIDLGYCSTRRSVAEHAGTVARVLDGLDAEGVEVSFVTHSLGALVVRDLLGREGDAWRERQTLGRAVFIAAPHQGAALARVAGSIPGAFWLYGIPSRELANGVTDSLATPTIPFMNIAGSKGKKRGWNALVPGDDDGVVGLTEAWLDGEAERLTVRAVHTFVMQDDEAIEAATRFIADGPLER